MATNDATEFIRARHIARPLSDAFSCSTENDSLDILIELRRRQYSFCPVIEDGNPIGIVAAADCQTDLKVRDIAQPIELVSVISADTELLEVAKRLLLAPFQFILEGSRLCGFVTETDLGSANGKSFAYMNLAAVEVDICKYLRICCLDQELAISSLGENRQSDLAKFINRLRSEDQFIDHFAACNLSDLLQIVIRQKEFRAEIANFGGWSRLSSGLPILRNDIMHPDRPLLGTHRSLGSFIKKIEHLQYIQKALGACLLNNNGDSPSSLGE
ncbi:CBS domain-containing protein [Arthrobacter silviterrae]|uniref:CBS domain-containing protein n=1 Tax=Arthrobacter silviterrae TaxID=2026658 RepID=A0ABX0DC32_9MICC|nr:hypothetical protein [Arthrobacter silviterrae]MDQ0279070.1 CBS domain-containing protein [Arthrobacter silviterrae]NGN84487.1 hypothetical protein [Arthrobacter silviterrae]